MNNTLRNTLIAIGVLVLAVGIFFAGSMYARFNPFGLGGMMNGYGWNDAYGPGGMMGIHGGNYGPGGMMGGRGGNYGHGGMMGGNGYNNTNATPLTVDQAKAAAQEYLTNLNNPDLKIAEVMVFNNNAYIVVKEASTGNGAFELLVDPASQAAYPEYGPNMMWNLKYGGLNHQYMMGGKGGMMGGSGEMMGRNGWDSTVPVEVSADTPVTPEKAIQYAQKYLDTNFAGATAATDLVKFYGYYTLDFEKDGKVVGMLSVNGYNGQVFLHTWHGTFIEESAMQ
jgi:hypothetical protein